MPPKCHTTKRGDFRSAQGYQRISLADLAFPPLNSQIDRQQNDQSKLECIVKIVNNYLQLLHIVITTKYKNTKI
jgi:hypothetical protein